MDFQLTKLELIEMLLRTKKETVLEKIQIILESDRDDSGILDDDVYAMLDNRRERHLNDDSKSYSWKEVKQKIDQHRQ
jgi:hypothetical protein